MCCLRRIGNISWKDRLTNERGVLAKLNAEGNLLVDIQKTKCSHYGHIKRGNTFCQLQWEANFKAEDQEGNPEIIG